jgi:hypothetical protein
MENRANLFGSGSAGLGVYIRFATCIGIASNDQAK